MVWPERDGGLGYQSLELIPGSLRPGAAQLLTNLSVVIQTNPITSSGPDQSHYQTWLCRCGPTWPDAWLSAPHTPMLLCLMAWTAVRAYVCGVSCWIPQEENMSGVISSIKLCLHALWCFFLASNWVFSQSKSTGAQNLLFPHTWTCSWTHTFTKF